MDNWSFTSHQMLANLGLDDGPWAAPEEKCKANFYIILDTNWILLLLRYILYDSVIISYYGQCTREINNGVIKRFYCCFENRFNLRHWWHQASGSGSQQHLYTCRWWRVVENATSKRKGTSSWPVYSLVSRKWSTSKLNLMISALLPLVISSIYNSKNFRIYHIS